VVADARYLAQWSHADALGDAPPNAPVVHVSWFAARAYCAWRKGRLPDEKEWELAAAPRDAAAERATRARILAWYAQLAPRVLPDVGQHTDPSGISDLHGLIWEWIEDFNAALVSADPRNPARDLFCGGAAAASTDPTAYATFLRLAFRSSLEARYTTALLGFRCAYDSESAP
jgi:formylglycine-generating enzyme required for sulfatase activity